MSDIQSPTLLLDAMQECLARMAAGDTEPYDTYEEVRANLLTAPELVALLPAWLIQLRYSTQMWSWLKAQSSDVEARQRIIRKAMRPARAIAEAPPGKIAVPRSKIILWAKDVDRSIRFFQETFGAALLMSSPFVSNLQVANMLIGIHNGGDGEITWTGLAFQVEDIETAAAAVKAAGGALEREPEPENGEPPHLAMCLDPDNNQFMLFRQR